MSARVTVLGSGAGALAVAADLARAGHETTLADLPSFAANLVPVRASGGVSVVCGWHGTEVQPVPVATDVETAVGTAEMVIVVVPAFGHEPFVDLLAPVLRDDQALLFFGEGSGAVVARQALQACGKGGVLVGETNTLPYLARLAGPGTVSAERKSGGVFLAAIPASRTDELLARIEHVWPYVSPAESVWETVLINYNAIDHVPTVLANAGSLEHRVGGVLLWGEGASPGVARAIEAVDAELLALRRALGFREQRRYGDFLKSQGFAPEGAGPGLYEVIRASKLAKAAVPTGPGGLDTRYLTEDVPYALVLAASIGDEIGVETPVIDGLIALSSAMLGRDFSAEGRTLARLGLAGAGLDGLRRFAATGEAQREGVPA